MKIIRCQTHMPTGNKDKWIYPWKEFTGTTPFFSSEYEYVIDTHRVARFLSLQAHLAIEHSLEALWSLVFLQFPFKELLLTYDILHGVLCGFNMKEILRFWRETD